MCWVRAAYPGSVYLQLHVATVAATFALGLALLAGSYWRIARGIG